MSATGTPVPSGRGGHRNEAFEPDIDTIDPVIEDEIDGQKKRPLSQGVGVTNEGFESDLNHENQGYVGLDEGSRGTPHINQDLHPSRDSNPKAAHHKNGDVSSNGNGVFTVAGNQTYYPATGAKEAHEYDNPKASYGVNRSLSYKGETEDSREAKNTTSHKTVCLITIFTALFLAIIAVAIFLILRFLVFSQPGLTTAQPTQSRTVQPATPMYLVSTSASATLDLIYTDALADPTSRDYVELESNFITLIDGAFSNTSVNITYRETTVNGFSNGSIIVNFIIFSVANIAEFTGAPTNNEETVLFVEETANSDVARVLADIDSDNAQSLPVSSTSVAGSEAQPIEVTTQRVATTQQPTEGRSSTEIPPSTSPADTPTSTVPITTRARTTTSTTTRASASTTAIPTPAITTGDATRTSMRTAATTAATTTPSTVLPSSTSGTLGMALATNMNINCMA